MNVNVCCVLLSVFVLLFVVDVNVLCVVCCVVIFLMCVGGVVFCVVVCVMYVSVSVIVSVVVGCC